MASRAIVVGISNYPGLPPLAGPEHDAVAFTEWLTDPGGGGLAPTDVRTILSSQYPQPPGQSPTDAQPTAEAFTAAVNDLVDQADEAGGRLGGRLYLYFAGHGFAPDSDSGALFMANAGRGRSGHNVPATGYSRWFVAAGLFDEVVLLMDACRSAGALLPLATVHLDPRAYQGDDPKVFSAYATKFDGISRERALAGGTTRGYFTSALIEGLERGADEQGRVTAESLVSYLTSWIDKNASHLGHPPVYGDVGQGRQIVFRQGPTPAYRVEADCCGGDPVELRDGVGTVIEPDSTTPTLLTWTLHQRGIYKLVRGTEHEYIDVDGTWEVQRRAC